MVKRISPRLVSEDAGRILLGMVVLVVAIAGVYWNSFPGSFHYDDYALMLESPLLTAPSFDYGIFLQQYGGRPLTFWTFYLNYLIDPDHAAGFHLVNLVLHGAVVLLLFWLFYRLTGKFWLSFLSALLFAVHPAQSSTVNYIWARSLILMSFFLLLSCLAQGSRGWLSILCFQLAAWSRVEAVVAVPLLILQDQRKWKAYLIVAVANVTAMVLFMLGRAPKELGWNHSDILGYWIAAPVAVLKYLKALVWPAGFSIYHSFPELDLFQIIISWLAFGFLLLLAWGLRRRIPEATAGIFLFLLLLSPSLSIPSSDLVSESRAYLASAGAIFAIVSVLLTFVGFGAVEGVARERSSSDPWEVGRLSNVSAAVRQRTSWSSRAGGVLVIVILLALSGQTFLRNRVWREDTLLWNEAVRLYPDDARPHYNLGAALAREGQLDGALREFEAASALNPEDDMSYAARGYCLETAGDWTQALQYYRKAIALNANNQYAADGISRVQSLMTGKGVVP